jgi:hypothetical protein
MSLITNVPEGDWIRGISIKQSHVACILAGAFPVKFLCSDSAS